MRRAIAGMIVLIATLAWGCPLSASPVPVHFAEGPLHGSLMLSTTKEVLIALGNYLQVGRDGEVESRLVFHFQDGSIFDETVVFTQRKVFSLQSYHLVRRGPVFPEDIEISLERASGKYSVQTKSHKDGEEKTLDGTIELPPDAYNGMFPIVLKNLSNGTSEGIHLVVFTPAPKIIKMELVPAGEDKMLVNGSEKIAIHYLLKPVLGIWRKFFALLLGHLPPDYHAWIVSGDVPAFVRFEGQLYLNGPVWRIETISGQPQMTGPP